LCVQVMASDTVADAEERRRSPCWQACSRPRATSSSVAARPEMCNAVEAVRRVGVRRARRR
jgi:hypothetical protein